MSNSKSLLTAVASLAASAMLVRSITNEFIPREVIDFFHSRLHNISRQFSTQLTIVIEEFRGMTRNQIFEAAEAYLGNKATLSAQRVKASKSENEKKVSFGVDRDEEVNDDFQGVRVRWKFVCVRTDSSGNRHNRHDLNASLRSEVRYYELSFHKKHKEKMFNSYLPYVMDKAKAIKQENMEVKLHTIDYRSFWKVDGVKFGHPMTFKTLAIDAGLKREILNDLEKFVKGKEFYKSIGKAWKRGYLLYGPPGTGKSSLIAAMACYLNYDIYDLDLTVVNDNNDLKNLILGMSNRSILVMEDIDCTIKLQNREDKEAVNKGENKVTLSGLLNIIDGLWSCCGEERIIIFTTNHKERLDPALLRPGRMDMHVHLSYCNFSSFEQLAFNYLGISHHKLFEQIEGLLREVQVTPAEIAGELIKIADSGAECLHEIVKFLHNKKMLQGKATIDQNIKEDQELGGEEL